MKVTFFIFTLLDKSCKVQSHLSSEREFSNSDHSIDFEVFNDKVTIVVNGHLDVGCEYDFEVEVFVGFSAVKRMADSLKNVHFLLCQPN